MEIKSVNKEINVEYPKLEEVNVKRLKLSIPKGWLKLGITSMVFGIIMKNKAFAISPDDVRTAGEVVTKIPTTYYINEYMPIVSICIFTVSIIGFLISAFSLNKKPDNKKIKNTKNAFLIISILSVVIYIIWNIIYTMFIDK